MLGAVAVEETVEQKLLDARIAENQEKLKMSTQLPHMVANVGELLDVEDEDGEGTILCYECAGWGGEEEESNLHH